MASSASAVAVLRVGIFEREIGHQFVRFDQLGIELDGFARPTSTAFSSKPSALTSARPR